MDLSGLGAGLSAVPGGYNEGMQQGNQIQMQQLQIREQRAKQAGMQAYFRALNGLAEDNQGPQPPMPGQASQPQQQAMPGPQMAGAPSPQAAPPMGAPGGAPQAQGASPMGGGAPQQQAPAPLTWQSVVMSLKKQNPGIDDMALASAVDHAMPLLNQQSKLEWMQLRNEMMLELQRQRGEVSRANTQDRTDASRDNADLRARTWTDTTQTKVDASRANTQDRVGVQREVEAGRGERFATGEDRRERALTQRDTQFQQREQRLQDSLALRSDQGYQRLEQQKQALAQRASQGGDRQAVIEWRAVVDAQHKLAMEKILSARDMQPKERQEFIKTQNEAYTKQINDMRARSGGPTTPTGGTAAPGTPKVPDRVEPSVAPGTAQPAQPAAPPSSSLPPQAAQQLKEGVVTTFGNGQKWTLENGQPKQVP